MDHVSEKPDIVCLSKALTGGFLPLSLTITTDKVYNAFLSEDPKKALIHGHSYTGNPIACAAACKSLEIFMRPETRQKVATIEQFYRSQPLEGITKRRTCGLVDAFDVTEICSNAASLCARSDQRSTYCRRCALRWRS